MDNEVLKAIRERRSLRRFKGEQVGDDALKAVLEAGTWAPTAFGRYVRADEHGAAGPVDRGGTERSTAGPTDGDECPRDGDGE